MKPVKTTQQKEAPKPFVLLDLKQVGALQFVGRGSGATTLTLKPGINAFSADFWAALEEQERGTVKRYFDAGLLQATPASAAWELSLAEFDLDTARRLVAGQIDLQVLNAWLSNEVRSALKNDIQDKIKAVQALKS